MPKVWTKFERCQDVDSGASCAVLAIYVLAHPALLGYTVARSGKLRTPHVYFDGHFAGDRDALLNSYNSGLLKQYATDSTRGTGKAFAGEHPIAMYWCAPLPFLQSFGSLVAPGVFAFGVVYVVLSDVSFRRCRLDGLRRLRSTVCTLLGSFSLFYFPPSVSTRSGYFGFRSRRRDATQSRLRTEEVERATVPGVLELRGSAKTNEFRHSRLPKTAGRCL